MVNHDFVSGRVRAGNGEVFGVLGIGLGFGFRETRGGISLFFEDLFITSRKLGLRFYRRYTVRHLKRELRQTRDGFHVGFADCGFEALPESVNGTDGGTGGIGAGESQEQREGDYCFHNVTIRGQY